MAAGRFLGLEIHFKAKLMKKRKTRWMTVLKSINFLFKSKLMSTLCRIMQEMKRCLRQRPNTVEA